MAGPGRRRPSRPPVRRQPRRPARFGRALAAARWRTGDGGVPADTSPFVHPTVATPWTTSPASIRIGYQVANVEQSRRLPRSCAASSAERPNWKRRATACAVAGAGLASTSSPASLTCGLPSPASTMKPTEPLRSSSIPFAPIWGSTSCCTAIGPPTLKYATGLPTPSFAATSWARTGPVR